MIEKLRDKFSIIPLTDGYKFTHWKMMPIGTQYVTSYLESRGGKYDELVYFGSQYLIREYFEGKVFDYDDILRYDEELKEYFLGKSLFNKEGWTKMYEKHGGKWPVEIKTMPEGLVTPPSNVMLAITNSDPEFPLVTNYSETLLVHVWNGIAVATNSRECKKIIKGFLEKNGTPELLPYKLHDFGFRGSSSLETARYAGAAHLVNFLSSDTYPAIQLIKTHYNPTSTIAVSVPASEHLIPMLWGKENEISYVKNMIANFSDCIVSIVGDTWDIYNMAENILASLKYYIEAIPKIVVVLRPDSGDPLEVLPRLFGILFEKFGYTDNTKGYKVLPNYLRVIQGDGIDRKMIYEILNLLDTLGISADNITFGSGGGLLQKHNRDDASIAFKGCRAMINNKWINLSKSPITSKTKASKSGPLKLIKKDDSYTTITELDPEFEKAEDLLIPVFKNGECLTQFDFESIRQLAKC